MGLQRGRAAVVSVVLGCRSGRQVEQGLASYRTAIPEQLWEALTDADLLPAATP